MEPCAVGRGVSGKPRHVIMMIDEGLRGVFLKHRELLKCFMPHIHMLVTMGGMKSNGEWKKYDFIPFEMLRKQWQTVVLKLIRKH